MNEWEVCPLGWACWNGYCRRPCFDEYDCVDPTFPRCYLGMCLLSERPDPDDGYWAGCGCGKSCWVPYNDDGDDGR